LCCACGQLRTVAASYRGRAPDGIQVSGVSSAPWCTWLRCEHCRSVTLHALIADSSRLWGSEGCDRERHNRLADRRRRRIERRLTALAADGLSIVRVASADDMRVDGAPVEVVEYDDDRRLQVRICVAAPTEKLLDGIEAAEDIVDEPMRLGDWTNTIEGRWRGLAIRS
jgi:hypothetical protein